MRGLDVTEKLSGLEPVLISWMRDVFTEFRSKFNSFIFNCTCYGAFTFYRIRSGELLSC